MMDYSSIDILKATLIMFEAEKYIPKFKKCHIKTNNLAALSDDDLKAIGIDDERLRNRLRLQWNNLPVEKHEIALDTLMQMRQIRLHSLVMYAVLCKNARLGMENKHNVKLAKATKCLIYSTKMFKDEMLHFQNKPSTMKANQKGCLKKNSTEKRKYLFLAMVSSIAFVSYLSFQYYS